MISNIVKWMTYADDLDRAIGLCSYLKYNEMLQVLADKYNKDFNKVNAAFCALSPNNDYVGNLRSLVGTLEFGNDAIVSTYNHCKERAVNYLNGEEFETKSRGMKILSFYRNIKDPLDPEPITIDGHMLAVYDDNPNAKMKDYASLSKGEYIRISEDFKQVAKAVGILPNQLQATLRYTRKRKLNILFDTNLSLFHDADKILLDLSEIPSYGRMK